MPTTTHLNASEKFEIQTYKQPKDIATLLRTHVAFSGSPRKKPNDSEKIILVADPFSTNTFYYEFNTEDISYAEELPTLTSPTGQTITMARIWVKKMSIGIRFFPFRVEEAESI
ncbi:MAG: inorganic pyrophosphatase Ppa [Desulfobacterales bacterium]|jgi:inorganic pyrophosphatase